MRGPNHFRTARLLTDLRQAFTLVELLVVIAIIAVLASALLPAVGRAKEAGRATSCRNNLRQLGVAANIYAGDAGRFPSMLEWLYLRTEPRNLESGQLYPYLKSKAVFLCPVDVAKVNAGSAARSTPPLTLDHSYSMNCRMCHANDVTKCFAPAKTVYFVEATNLPPELTGSSITPPGDEFGPFSSAGGKITLRHGARAQLLMIDTHIERKKWSQLSLNSDKRLWFPNDTVTFTPGAP